MTRLSIFTSAVLTTLLTAGCDKAIDDQTKVTSAQIEANDKIAAANKEAEQKRLAAQGQADKTMAEATANFMKLREDYRHQTTNNLVELDRRIDLLDASSKLPGTKNKADLDANLQQIHARRSAFAADYMGLEAASAGTWDATKARLDKEWTELKALVDKA